MYPFFLLLKGRYVIMKQFIKVSEDYFEDENLKG
ncbi:replication initiator protein A, partial [Lentilactobacillus hilgardii]|nr:replication initiator protein A [Lentilactobacillus hilgardii]